MRKLRWLLLGFTFLFIGSIFVHPVNLAQNEHDIGEICLYFDETGRGDLSFNDMAYLGAERASNQFGLEIRTATASDPASYLPDLQQMAKSGECGLIIGVGFLLSDALPETARQFPNQKFAFVDGASGGISNILGLLFKETEASPPIGSLAALGAISRGYQAVGLIGGREIPPVWRYEAGFRFGVHWALDWYNERFGEKKEVRILTNYVGSFADIPAGKQAAETQLASGAYAIFGVAGASHLGAFDAVKEAATNQGRKMGPPYAYGADASQEYIQPGFIQASAMKRINVATFEAVKQVVEGNFQGGKDLVLGLSEKGVGLSSLNDILDFINLGIEAGQIEPENKDTVFAKIYKARWSPEPWIWEAVTTLESKIASGELQIPPASTAKQIEEVRNQYP